MSVSIATLWIGPGEYPTYSASGYSFGSAGAIPQIGIRSDYQRAGESKLAPTNEHRIVTLHGHFSGINLNAIQTKIAALRAALSKEGQVLYFHDGTLARINNEAVVVDSVDIPVQWGQYHSDYTVQLSYWPLNDVHKAPATVSYGSYVFCTDGGTKPIPVIGREERVERQSPDADRESTRVTVTLSSFFEEGSISANNVAFAALEAALATDGLTLVYGSFSQTGVKVVGGPTHHEDTLQRRLYFTIQFMYVTSALGNGVIKKSSMRSVTRITQRYVPHYVPYIDAARVQILGRGGQKITATGYIIADTLADAETAAQIEIAAQFPTVNTPAELVYAYGATYSGVEDPSSNVKRDVMQKRVDWNVERFFGGAPDVNGAATWPLYGGLYGTGL